MYLSNPSIYVSIYLSNLSIDLSNLFIYLSINLSVFLLCVLLFRCLAQPPNSRRCSCVAAQLRSVGWRSKKGTFSVHRSIYLCIYLFIYLSFQLSSLPAWGPTGFFFAADEIHLLRFASLPIFLLIVPQQTTRARSKLSSIHRLYVLLDR